MTDNLNLWKVRTLSDGPTSPCRRPFAHVSWETWFTPLAEGVRRVHPAGVTSREETISYALSRFFLFPRASSATE